MTKPTMRLVQPARTQISLPIHAVWSESSLMACAFYSLRAIQRGMNKNPCHTGCIFWLIWVFCGHTDLIVGFVVLSCTGSYGIYLNYWNTSKGKTILVKNIHKMRDLDRHYENKPIQIYWKFYHQKWIFSNKNSDIFHIFAENIDCGYLLELPQQGTSIKYPQSMFLSRNKNNNVYPCKPH